MKNHCKSFGIPEADVDNCLGKYELYTLATQHHVQFPENPKKLLKQTRQTKKIDVKADYRERCALQIAQWKAKCEELDAQAEYKGASVRKTTITAGKISEAMEALASSVMYSVVSQQGVSWRTEPSFASKANQSVHLCGPEYADLVCSNGKIVEADGAEWVECLMGETAQSSGSLWLPLYTPGGKLDVLMECPAQLAFAAGVANISEYLDPRGDTAEDWAIDPLFSSCGQGTNVTPLDSKCPWITSRVVVVTQGVRWHLCPIRDMWMPSYTSQLDQQLLTAVPGLVREESRHGWVGKGFECEGSVAPSLKSKAALKLKFSIGHEVPTSARFVSNEAESARFLLLTESMHWSQQISRSGVVLFDSQEDAIKFVDHRVFGVPLFKVLKHQSECTRGLPCALEVCFDWLENRANEVMRECANRPSGFYTLHGLKKQSDKVLLKQWEYDIDRGNKFHIPDNTNPLNVELLMITFIQEIPEPILSKSATKLLIEAYDASESSKVAQALDKLRKPERNLIDALINHWKRMIASQPKKRGGVIAHMAGVFTPLLTQENSAIAAKMTPAIAFMLETMTDDN